MITKLLLSICAVLVFVIIPVIVMVVLNEDRSD